MNLKIEAENIKCGGCARTIMNKPGKAYGVQNVGIDIETGIVTIDGGLPGASNMLTSRPGLATRKPVPRSRDSVMPAL